MKKKLLLTCVMSLVTVAALIPLLLAPSANAASSEELFDFRGGKIYGINNTTVTSIDVPAEIGGEAVTIIDSAVFASCANLEEITLPDTITNIGTDAFKNTAFYNDATNWENDVLYIGKYLIEGKDSMSGDYTVKANTKLIAESAFDECIGLKNVIVPGTVTTIQNYAFEGCTGLESITISNGVKTIGEKAFNGCSSLQSITLPSSITSVAKTAFAACTNIDAITLPENGINFGGKTFGDTKYYNTVANWEGGLLYAGKHLIGIKASDVGYQFEIKDGTIAFEAYDPTGVFRVVQVTIPKSLKYIDADVFKDYPKGIMITYNGTEQEWTNVTVSGGNDKIKGRVRFTLGGKRTVIASDYLVQNTTAKYDRIAKAVTVGKTNNAVGDVTDIKYEDANGNKLSEAVNAGTYKVLISTAESTDFAAATELEVGTLTISKLAISANDVTLGPQLTYTGRELTQTVSVTVDGTVLTEGTDYTVSGNKQNDAGTYPLAVTGKGNYSGTAYKDFTIAQKSISDATVNLDASLTYTGRELTQTVSVTVDGTVLTEGTDYTVSGNEQTNVGPYTLTVTGKGNYSGTAYKDFTIAQKSISDATVNLDASLTYTGRELTQTVSVTVDGTALTEGTDYTVSGNKQTDVGPYTLTVTGKGNYSGTVDKGFTIAQKSISDATVNLGASLTYTGRELTQTVSVTVDGTVLTEGTDYTVSGNKQTDAGPYTLTVTGNGNYTGTADKDFTIAQKSISEATVNLGASLTHTGRELTQTVSVTVDGTALTEGTDYTVSGNKQTDAGPYTLTVTGKGNYTGTADKGFTILQASVEGEGVTVGAFEEMTYTGNPQTPKAEVKIGTLKAEGTWSNVTNVSDLTTFTATGNFIGKIENKAIGMKKAVATQSSENVTYATALRGSSLEEAEVTAGEFFGLGGAELTGKLEWKDKTEGVLGSTTAAMIFTADGGNYEPLEIQVEVLTYTSGNTTARYQVKFNTNGGSKIASKTVLKNSRVSEPAEPVLEGFTFGGWYTDSRFRRKYNFDSKVTESFTLYAKWIDNEEPSDDDAEEDDDKEEVMPWKNPFGDVNEKAWYYKYVECVTEEGLMNGISEDEFGPDATLTRAMLVTILYRAAGEPAVNKAVPFGDVKAGTYYANAVIWAQQNGIVNGMTENEFAPDESITREQIATIIYRYAVYMGLDVTQGGMQVREFADYDSIADYALNAITWAVNVGVMNGKTETTLNPKDNATRAEIAAILQRFLEA